MKTVYLFTNTFPYGINSETFIEEEMRVAGNLGLHIVVLPLHRKKVCRCVQDKYRESTPFYGIQQKDW